MVKVSKKKKQNSHSFFCFPSLHLKNPSGVVSKEFWTIVSVPDDLGYALFSYNGAASAAGQAYSGSVLCTRDGAWPDPERYGAQLDAALNEAGVKTWELFRVNNDSCEGAPLEIEEG